MLEKLRIRNFAIIDELDVSFTGGLNMITGETGAGKSIIIGAMSLILGDRASSDQIRTSEDSASIEALFTIDGNRELNARLEEFGFDPQPELLIKRTISRSGKNRIHINGQPATLGVLAALSGLLVDICGQHEHQVILDPANHIDILDEVGGLLPLRSEYRKKYDAALALKLRLEELKKLSEDKVRAEAYLKYQLKEIEDADPAPGEDAVLADEKKIIRNAGFLQQSAEACYDALYAGEGSIIAGLSEAVSRVREIKKIDPGLNISVPEMEGVVFTLEEAAFVLREYLQKINFDPARLEQIEDRLELLGRLKRKYGADIGDILKKRDEIRRELAGFSTAESEIERLTGELQAAAGVLQEKASELSAQRRSTAKKLQTAVEREIRQLKMDNARFEVRFRKRPCGGDPISMLDAKGMDEIEFYLSPNVGEDLKPLNHIASGGELSRIILAMKKALAGAGSVGTIIFDEVDSGIGGAVAEAVGEKIRDVAASRQIICITHLPQIACFGDTHFVVKKQVEGDRTKARIDPLSQSERLEEIARMLAGADITEKTRAHAGEMLNRSKLRS
jgi:DNA repair protein RecN (Recombination protein N)